MTFIAIVLNGGKFIIGGSDLGGLFKEQKSTLMFLAAIPVVAFVGNDMAFQKQAQQIERQVNDSIQSYVDGRKSGKIYNLKNITSLKMGASDEKAIMVIHEFADYQCGHCLHAGPTLKAFALSRDDVQYNFITFPLDSQCNPVMNMSQGGLRCQLAQITWCAQKEGKGWAAHDWAFGNFYKREVLADVDLAAKTIGLDPNKLKECMVSNEISDLITLMSKKGEEFGVQGTPTIFVNGVQLPAGQALPVLTKMHDLLK